jgi:anti-sigma factor RsiW
MSQHVDPVVCSEFRELVDAWIDGELDAAEETRLAAHLESCVGCRQERELAASVRSQLRALPEMDLPESVAAAVRRKTRAWSRVRLSGLRPGPFFRPLPVAAAAAVAVAVIVILVIPWKSANQPQFSDREIEQALQQTRLALAVVDNATRRAEFEVRRRVIADGVVAERARGFMRTLDLLGGDRDASVAPTFSPSPNQKGS